ncbi:MAG TPA: HEAT repeat domain-containing protein [Allosphingosinicella sp.]|nr:HEAT repeat domain-containing protein [Allosphingosinicella sp.]
MIFGQALSEWTFDRRRHRQTEKDIANFADQWNLSPTHRRIAAAMAAIANPDAEQVADAVRELFDDDGWAVSLIDSLAAEMQRDPFFVPPFRHLNSDVHQGLIVYEDELVSIAAGVSGVAQLATKKSAPRGATSIGFSGQISLIKFIRAGEARLSFWEAPRIEADFSAAEAGACARVAERVMTNGETILVDGRYESFVIEHAKTNIVLLQATLKSDQAPLSVEYDSASHRFVGCSAADDSASRIQMITTLLRKLDCDAAFPVMVAFLDNPNFFVRWHVMRELLGLDLLAALPHLERMATSDRHKENRRLAREVLASIKADQPGLSRAA